MLSPWKCRPSVVPGSVVPVVDVWPSVVVSVVGPDVVVWPSESEPAVVEAPPPFILPPAA
jgi:hypothetical protein